MRVSKTGAATLLAVLLCAVLAASAAAVERPTAVIAYYGSDEAGPDPGLPEKVAGAMFESSGEPNTVEEYFRVQTFGTVGFSGGIDDVYGPYQLATPKANCPWPTWNNEARQKAVAEDGFDEADYSQVVYIYENEPFVASECSAAGVGGGGFVWIDSLSGYTIVHELGHLLGSPHAAAYRCRAADGVTPVAYSGDCAEVFPPGDSPSEYGDPFDPMGFGHLGGLAAEMTAWRKLGFGAIPASDAPVVTRNGTYTIAPLEQSSGTRLLRIPNGAGDFFDLDFRQRIGPFDSSYAPTDPAVNGVAIHLDDPGFDTGVHPSRLLDMSPQTATFEDAPLTVGSQFTDFRTRVTIETLAAGPGGATVRIGGLPEEPVIPNPRPDRCRVPKLKRKKAQVAKKAIRRTDCKLGKVKRRHSRKVPKGKVISQVPKAGREVAGGAKVTIVVSSGPPKPKGR